MEGTFWKGGLRLASGFQLKRGEGVTVDRYVDLICAINYLTLVNQGVQNQYEVMIAVMGMTIEKIGISPFEVFWTSSFTNDLGID